MTIYKTVAIAELEGISITDPAYTKGMPYLCYEAATKVHNVQMELIAHRGVNCGICRVQPDPATQGCLPGPHRDGRRPGKVMEMFTAEQTIQINL